jgi:hypothetical protein
MGEADDKSVEPTRSDIENICHNSEGNGTPARKRANSEDAAQHLSSGKRKKNDSRLDFTGE